GCSHLEVYSFPTRRSSDRITKIIDDGICRGVADFCHEVLRMYGDGTINGMTLASVEIAISAVRDIPSKIEEIKEQKDSGSGILRDRKSTRLNSSHVSISYA